MVTFNSRGPRFESSHQQKFILTYTVNCPSAHETNCRFPNRLFTKYVDMNHRNQKKARWQKCIELLIKRHTQGRSYKTLSCKKCLIIMRRDFKHFGGRLAQLQRQNSLESSKFESRERKKFDQKPMS